MLEFISQGTFNIAGRGVAFCVLNPTDCSDFDHLIGHTVLIDGTAHRVAAVERFAHMPPWRKGESISLLVKPVGVVEVTA